MGVRTERVLCVQRRGGSRYAFFPSSRPTARVPPAWQQSRTWSFPSWLARARVPRPWPGSIQGGEQSAAAGQPPPYHIREGSTRRSTPGRPGIPNRGGPCSWPGCAAVAHGCHTLPSLPGLPGYSACIACRLPVYAPPLWERPGAPAVGIDGPWGHRHAAPRKRPGTATVTLYTLKPQVHAVASVRVPLLLG